MTQAEMIIAIVVGGTLGVLAGYLLLIIFSKVMERFK